MLKKGFYCLMFCLFTLAGKAWGLGYPVVDTGQDACFDERGQVACPGPDEAFRGQDAQYRGNRARYRDNRDGTVSDLVTGLMWVKARGGRMSWDKAMDEVRRCRVGGYDDWRAPTIKELYSLMDFNGWVQGRERDSIPYLDTRYFGFEYGNPSQGQRVIDCQDWSSTVYRGQTLGGNPSAFGVNFADGRIKGYPQYDHRGLGRFMRFVRGNPNYGKNDFLDNGDGTVSDRATGLTWQRKDSGGTKNWRQALAYCENLELGGRTDWRLPNAKELQSIVDYTRSPPATGSAAIDPIFAVTEPESYFWTSTTHLSGPRPDRAVYVAFGRAMGYFAPPGSSAAKLFLDVHGAGAQRSDPKSGNPARFPQGHGPQGDDIRILNYARCVTDGGVAMIEPENLPIPAWKGGDPNISRQGQGMRQGSEQGMRPRGGPPEEAYTACENKELGDGCTVRTPHGTLSGICRNTPDGTVCVPEGRMGPPPMQ
ncbi:DUF1566 domain-containing protein [Pseudodesulfovibrio cashew]|uniref:DUF1566 domain-containing protein n=1 Tax=Pseudodesulfovibrio cashew TaxID=2678688 RepID=A0A6I6J9R6_9BACT|nr:DUF1566 domain-containing protein [Pseudodesulfovibrio cashew]QGY39395.1 DUF1566 domain-containing protein [Pseudodesulfovibrio cashew]